MSGASVKILDWSDPDVTFDAGSAPTRANFTPRLEKNADLRKVSVTARADGLYLSYVTHRYPLATILVIE